MNQINYTIKHVFALLTAGVLITACAQKEERLPLLVKEVVAITKDGKSIDDTIYRTIPAFSYFNEDSVLISNAVFDGKIYVADFFFTTCPTICPTMHRNMMKVFKKYETDPNVMFLSHTIDYKYDLPSRLKRYKEKLGVKSDKWQFAWDTKEKIYTTARENYLVAVIEDNAAPGGYVHQGYLVLVDKHRRVRGAYDGIEDEQVAKLMTDMDILLKEQ